MKICLNLSNNFAFKNSWVHSFNNNNVNWDSKAKKIIFVVYCKDSKGYRLFTSNVKTVYSRDFTFFEDAFDKFGNSDQF